MRRFFVSAVIFLFAAGARAEAPAAKVTFAQLLAHPEKFVDRRVDVAGYCHTSNEEISLSANKRADEQRRGCENSIWLDIVTSLRKNAARDEELSLETVRVIGTFRYQPRPILDKSVPYQWRFGGFGSYKMWTREITDITYLQPIR